MLTRQQIEEIADILFLTPDGGEGTMLTLTDRAGDTIARYTRKDVADHIEGAIRSGALDTLQVRGPGKYGVIWSEKKQFHPGEPLFLLRPTDPLAVKAVARYGRLAEEAGCGEDFVHEIWDHSERIQKWQQSNPSLVKSKPD